MKCPKCGRTKVHCPECGKSFNHGERSRCDNESCVAVNAPLDCRCGLSVADDLSGVIDFNHNLLPYK